MESDQDLTSLQGKYFKIWEVGSGNTISGEYETLQYKGDAIKRPYDIEYNIDNVTVFFPTFSPTTSPSSTPSGAPSTPPSTPPSPIPSERPTTYPTTLPTLETKKPSAEPSNAPSKKPSGAPTNEPSTAPSSEPSFEPTEQPIVTAFPACATHYMPPISSIQEISLKIDVGGKDSRSMSKVSIKKDVCFFMTGNTFLTVKTNSIINVLKGGALGSYGLTGHVDVYGSITIDEGYFEYFGANAGILVVHPQGSFSVMNYGLIHKVLITVAGNFSSANGGYLEASSITLLSSAVHNVVVGEKPLELLSYNGTASNATIAGTLNIKGNITDLSGTLPIWRASGGSAISSEYEQILLNGLPVNCTVLLSPNANKATSMKLVFHTNSARRLLETPEDVSKKQELGGDLNSASSEQLNDHQIQQHIDDELELAGSAGMSDALADN